MTADDLAEFSTANLHSLILGWQLMLRCLGSFRLLVLSDEVDQAGLMATAGTLSPCGALSEGVCFRGCCGLLRVKRLLSTTFSPSV